MFLKGLMVLFFNILFIITLILMSPILILGFIICIIEDLGWQQWKKENPKWYCGKFKDTFK